MTRHTHVSNRTACALAAGLVMSMLQGCAGSIPTRTALPSVPLSAKASSNEIATNSTMKIYIADALQSVISIFDPTGKLTGTITSGVLHPSGLLVDGNQNLWVANSKTVTMYRSGQTSPARTLNDENGSPDDISVARDGTVYVTNFFHHSVSVYAPGSNTATRTLTVPHSQYVVGVAVDATDNLFVTYNDPTGVGYIDEFAGAAQTGLKRLPPRFSWASDVKIDNAGNLLVLDWGEYHVTEFTEAGHPTGLSIFTFFNWNSFDMTSDGKEIAGTQALPDVDFGVLKTLPPGGTTVARFYNKFGGGIAGVAIAPGRFP